MSIAEAGRINSEAPNPLSSRISWWPYTKAPDSVRRVVNGRQFEAGCQEMATVSRRYWWVGVCGEAENPDGFPPFMAVSHQLLIGRYWFGLTFAKLL